MLGHFVDIHQVNYPCSEVLQRHAEIHPNNLELETQLGTENVFFLWTLILCMDPNTNDANGWKKNLHWRKHCKNANHFRLTSHRIAKLLKFIFTSTHVASLLGRFFSMSRLVQAFWQQPVWQTQGFSNHEFSVSRFYELIQCNFSHLSMNFQQMPRTLQSP